VIITDVQAFKVVLPLARPLHLGSLKIDKRDYAFVRIRTADGKQGTGFGFNRDGLVPEAIVRHLKPLLLGEEALHTERLWERMYRGTRFHGRRGLLMRAISAVDIALWDLKGQYAGMPLWQLLGGYAAEVPAYVAGGYYRADANTDTLRREYADYREQGYRGAKIMVGGATLAEDVRRVAAAREGIGEELPLMVDFNGALSSAKQALAAMEAFAPYQPAFVEEPFLMDNRAALRGFCDRTNVPVAVGEDESGRWAFRELIGEGLVDVLRHDATLVGGISEWIKVTMTGLSHEIPFYPHWFPEVHIHMAAAFPQGWGVELIPASSGIMGFDKLLDNPVELKAGVAHAPDEPGLGLRWNEEALEKWVVI